MGIVLQRILLQNLKYQFHRLRQILQAFLLRFALAISTPNLKASRPKAAFIRIAGVENGSEMAHPTGLHLIEALGNGLRNLRRPNFMMV